jgi:hypothetical protein
MLYYILVYHCMHLNIYIHKANWRHPEHLSLSLVSEEEMIRMRNFVI